MELVITLQELESLRKKNEDLVSEPLGFLNSEYKSLVTESLKMFLQNQYLEFVNV